MKCIIAAAPLTTLATIRGAGVPALAGGENATRKNPPRLGQH